MTAITISGSSSYSIGNGSVSMMVGELMNSSTNTNSGSLRLELWALPAPYSGSSATGYQLAVSPDLTFNGSYSLLANSYTTGPTTTTSPLLISQLPEGTYYVTLFIAEYTDASPSVDNGFVEDDWVNFSGAVDVNSAGTWSQETAPGGTIGATPTYTIDPNTPTVTVSNGSTTTEQFTVTRSGDTSQASTVPWSLVAASSNVTPADFSGDNGSLPSGTVTFAPDQSTATISVGVVGSAISPSPTSFAVTLSTGATTTSSISATNSGGTGVHDNYYTIAAGGGTLEIDYNMYTIPDSMVVFVNGAQVATTGGFVSYTGTLTDSNLKTGDLVDVQMTGNPDSSTEWEYSLTYNPGLVQKVEAFATVSNPNSGGPNPNGGTLTVNGTDTDTGTGSLSGTLAGKQGANDAFDTDGTYTINGSGLDLDDVALDNEDDLTVDGPVSSNDDSDDTVTNGPTGTVVLEGDNTLQAASLTNQGTIETDPGVSDDATIDAPLDNTGTVDVPTGTVNFNDGGTTDAQGLDVAAGATADLGGSMSLTGGTYDPAGTTGIDPGADVSLAPGAAIDLGSTDDFGAGSTLNLSNGTAIGDIDDVEQLGTEASAGGGTVLLPPDISQPAPDQWQSTTDGQGDTTSTSPTVDYNPSSGSWNLPGFTGSDTGAYQQQYNSDYEGSTSTTLEDVEGEAATLAAVKVAETAVPAYKETFEQIGDAVGLYQTLSGFVDSEFALMGQGINAIVTGEGITPEEYDQQFNKNVRTLEVNLLASLTKVPFLGTVINTAINKWSDPTDESTISTMFPAAGTTPTVTVSSGDNVVIGAVSANDVLIATGGNNLLDGNGGNDTLIGGSGTDTLIAGTGNSTLEGGSGTETMVVGSGDDTVIGGSGTDIAVFAGASTGYSINENFGVVTVTGSGAGLAIGTATLTNIGALEFSDVTIAVSSLPEEAGTGIDFLGDGGTDEFIRLGTGQLTVNELNGSGTVLASRAFTTGGNPFTIGLQTPVVGNAANFLSDGFSDLFIVAPSGQLTVQGFNAQGARETTWNLLNSNGSAFTVAPESTVVGSAANFLSDGFSDLFVVTPSGQLTVQGFNAQGTRETTWALVNSNGASFVLGPQSSVVGNGANFLSDGFSDLFILTASGQLIVQGFNAQGARETTWALLASNGSAFTPGPRSSVVGSGANFLSDGFSDLFILTASGQLTVQGFNAQGTRETSWSLLASNGSAFTSDPLATVVGTGANFLSDGYSDLFMLTANGQLTVQGFNAQGTRETSWSLLASNGSAFASDPLAKVVGTGANFLSDGFSDLFILTASGQLTVQGFNAQGTRETSWSLLASNGSAFASDPLATVVGTGVNFLSDGYSDLFMLTASGQLTVQGFNAQGTRETSWSLLASNGSAFASDPLAKVVGTGANFLSDGFSDLFILTASGQLTVQGFNAQGTRETSWSLLASNGSAFTSDPLAKVVGTGANFLSDGFSDLFILTASGQLTVQGFNAQGTRETSWSLLASNGSAFTSDPLATVVGTGANFLSDGYSDLFILTAGGQLTVQGFNAQGTRETSWSLLASNGSAFTSDPLATVVGTGANFLSDGYSDLFILTAGGQLTVQGFNAQGTRETSWNLLATNGSAFTEDPQATVVGTGVNFLTNGFSDLFIRTASGQLTVQGFNAAGTRETTWDLLASNGSAFTSDPDATVVGTGANFLSNGYSDLFILTPSGQLTVQGFNAEGTRETSWNLLATNGSAFTSDPDATVMGTGANFLSNGFSDLFIRTAGGQLTVQGFNAQGTRETTWDLFNSNGSAYTIDPLARVVGTGTNYISPGGNDLFIQSASGQVSVAEFNNSGILTDPVTLPAPGNGGAGQVIVGTSGADTLTGPSGASTLIGDGGNDTYGFGAGATQEVIVNGTTGNVAAQGTLDITATNADTSLWLDRVNDNGSVSATGNDLRIDVLGTTNSVTIDNWFAAGDLNAQLAEIALPNAAAGVLKLDSGVNNLVQAMATFEGNHQTTNGAAFDPTNPANSTITDPTVLAAVNTAWHH